MENNTCQCKPLYNGDGLTCTGEPPLPLPACCRRAGSPLLHVPLRAVTVWRDLSATKSTSFHHAASETNLGFTQIMFFSEASGWAHQLLPSRRMMKQCASVRFWRQQGFRQCFSYIAAETDFLPEPRVFGPLKSPWAERVKQNLWGGGVTSLKSMTS